jgi:hypothetical protein
MPLQFLGDNQPSMFFGEEKLIATVERIHIFSVRRCALVMSTSADLSVARTCSKPRPSLERDFDYFL